MNFTLTEKIARAAGLDAGNRSMYAHRRHQWNDDDYDAATQEFVRLMSILGYKMGEEERRQ